MSIDTTNFFTDNSSVLIQVRLLMVKKSSTKIRIGLHITVITTSHVFDVLTIKTLKKLLLQQMRFFLCV